MWQTKWKIDAWNLEVKGFDLKWYFVFSASPITIEMQNLSSFILNLRVCMLLIVEVLLHFRHLIFSKSLKVSFFMSHFLVAV